MDVDISTCPFCYYEYNQTSHLPRILPKCGHTLCSSCLEKLVDGQTQIKCPVDHGVFDIPQTIENLSINTKALAIIEERAKLEFCPKHCEEVIKICVSDRTKLCRRCVSTNTHKDHEVRSLEEIRNQGADKKFQLETLVQDYEKSKDNLQSLILKEQTSLVENVQNRIEALKVLLDQQKNSIVNSINLFFSLEQKKFDIAISANLPSIGDIQGKISTIHKNKLNEDYLQIIEEQLPILTANLALEKFNKSLADLQYKFEGSLNTYQIALKSQIQAFKLLLLVDQSYILDNNPEKIMPFKDNCEISISDDFRDLVLSSRYSSTENYCVPITTHNLAQLQHVKLIFDNAESIKDIIYSLATISNHLPEIPFLELNFADKQIDEKEFIEVIEGSAFSYLTEMNVKALSFSFEGCSNLGDPSMSLLFLQVLSKVKNVQDLRLHLGNTDISDQGLQIFGKEAVPKIIDKLECFKLQLHTTPITDAGLVPLFAFPLENIKKLELDFSNTQISNTAIEAFTTKTLPSMKKLDTLNLNLSNTDISNQSLPDLINKNIRNFKLSLDCTKVSSSGVNSFLKKCSGVMTDLESFELYLDYTDVEEEKLSKVLSTFRADSLLLSCKQLKAEKGNSSPDKQNKSVLSKLTKKLTKSKS